MLSVISRGEIEGNVGVAGDMPKEFAALPQTLQLFRRYRHLVGLRLVGFGKLDNAVGLREGKRAEQHSVHDREYCGIRADPQRQCQNSDNGEPRTLRQHTDRVAKVLPDGTHLVPPGVMLRRPLLASPRRFRRQTDAWYARRNLRSADRV